MGGGALVAAPVLAACGSDGDDRDQATEESAPEPVRGGRLRMGVTTGSPTDTLDSQNVISAFDALVAYQLYDRLADIGDDGEIELTLAEEAEVSRDGMAWTIRLRPDVTWHDGSAVTADDVLFSVRRIADPAAPKFGAPIMARVDLGNLERLDERTVRLNLTAPNFALLAGLADYFNPILPDGFDPANAVGSGPFKLVSFTPGEGIELARNENYWRDGEPYVDELAIANFADPTAAQNALLSGQIDLLAGGDPDELKGQPGVKSIEYPTGVWLPFTMATDVAPFDDVRVRQAMRLLVNRTEMLDQVLSGRGQIANDLFSADDPCYASDLPQREYDPEAARSLLRRAGHDTLDVELVIAAGVAPEGIGEVFAQQAQAGGVRIRVRQVEIGTWFSDYPRWPFSTDIWDSKSFLSITALALLGGTSFFNPTHWNQPRFNELYDRALGAADEAARCELIGEMQQILYDEGGYIIPWHPDGIQSMRENVNGARGGRSGVPGKYLRQVHLA